MGGQNKMPRYKVAHIREQGVDLIIIPLNSAFHDKNDQEKSEIICQLQTRANGAGLAGTVVPVWDMGNRMEFIAPQTWHPFLRSISWQFVLDKINREIFWD
jgi:hypothetical protein